MKIVYHLGAHATDDDRLIRALMKNRAVLEDMGIAVPSPRSYNKLIPKVAKSLKGAPAGEEAQHVILDAVLEDKPASRVIFSHENFICFPANVISEFGFYATMPMRLRAYANLFPQARTDFFLGLVNPAILIPALLRKVPEASYDSLMAGRDPRDLRWAPIIRRALANVPEAGMTIWCNEDTPFIWPELLRLMAGVPLETELEGDLDLLRTLLSEDGLTQFQAHMERHPPATIEERRQVTARFMEDHARPDEIEMEIPLPGWTDALVEEISRQYEEDCAEIADIPGVRFLEP